MGQCAGRARCVGVGRRQSYTGVALSESTRHPPSYPSTHAAPHRAKQQLPAHTASPALSDARSPPRLGFALLRATSGTARPAEWRIRVAAGLAVSAIASGRGWDTAETRAQLSGSRWSCGRSPLRPRPSNLSAPQLLPPSLPLFLLTCPSSSSSLRPHSPQVGGSSVIRSATTAQHSTQGSARSPHCSLRLPYPALSLPRVLVAPCLSSSAPLTRRRALRHLTRCCCCISSLLLCSLLCSPPLASAASAPPLLLSSPPLLFSLSPVVCVPQWCIFCSVRASPRTSGVSPLREKKIGKTNKK